MKRIGKMEKAALSCVIFALALAASGCARQEHYLVVGEGFLMSADGNHQLFTYHFNRDYYDAVEKLRVEREARAASGEVLPAYEDLGKDFPRLDTLFIALNKENAGKLFDILQTLSLEKDLAEGNASAISRGLEERKPISLSRAALKDGRAIKLEQYALSSDDSGISVFDAAAFSAELQKQKRISERIGSQIDMIQKALEAAGYHWFS